MTVIAWLNVLIILSLSCAHFYWATRGTKGLKRFPPKYVIPTSVTGKLVFSPGPFLTSLVATGLLFVALITVLSQYQTLLPAHYLKLTLLVIGLTFTLRAIGDFNLMGFTKKIKSTDFAKLDTKIYSPLCLYLGLSYLLIYLS